MTSKVISRLVLEESVDVPFPFSLFPRLNLSLTWRMLGDVYNKNGKWETSLPEATLPMSVAICAFLRACTQGSRTLT